MSPCPCQVLSASTVRLCSDGCAAILVGPAWIGADCAAGGAPQQRASPSQTCTPTVSTMPAVNIAGIQRRGTSRARLAASPRPMRWPVSGATTSASAVKPPETTSISARLAAASTSSASHLPAGALPGHRRRNTQLPPPAFPIPAVYPTETMSTTGNKQEPCRPAAGWSRGAISKRVPRDQRVDKLVPLGPCSGRRGAEGGRLWRDWPSYQHGAGLRAPASQLGGIHRVRAGVRRIAGFRLADPAVLGHAGRHRHDHRRRRSADLLDHRDRSGGRRRARRLALLLAGLSLPREDPGDVAAEGPSQADRERATSSSSDGVCGPW